MPASDPPPDARLSHLAEVDEALARLSPQLDALLDTVLDQSVSDYPITVWTRERELEVGVLVTDDARPGHWTVRLTTLEEFVSKGLMQADRVAEFRKVFADARKQYCLFVVTLEGASFAFRPRA